ncbi:MAG: Preprotein translocase, SecE subunit [Parcubacteria group bacterium GW2011_GWB2_40_8]|nr:MAG: Preprotein translocase, SecE subunit [Parcubacteria group bacterium GW2011_GWA2_40_143]KKR60519.1 MAG: Preprotein translocase, SecE subunit [Parcubacteria group bacterium GW2011_GWC2_40_31]KKR75633.1 MAG: Preprotein translocase, SecE subunit [Parcubacteria group bacterium GW2011_GWB2_40_8]KKR76519.1 MAG: Preprotein translocase, SecE subunit [Parcubacteria group bacterium GW2011_GWE2_40_8]KKR80428.1 MAG: Preprotein translocase, SecE subunit [Parcubacteria group bacterium GW2011_GWD2_40_9
MVCSVAFKHIDINSPHGAFLERQAMNKLINYIKETKAELKNVSWPSKRQTMVFTAMVVAASLATAAFLGFFDVIFSFLLKEFII